MKKLMVLCILTLLLLGCTKYSPFGESTLEVHAYNPVTEEPIEGVICKLYELEINGNNGNVDSTLLFDGSTNDQGLYSYTFLPKSTKGKYFYDYLLLFDYSNMNLPPGNYELLSAPDYLNVYFQEPIVTIPINIVPEMSFVYHVKNINCFDANDKARYRLKWPYTGSNEWISHWVPVASYYFGCQDTVRGQQLHGQDSVYWEIEVTRNGNTFIVRDSMLLDPTKVQDTIKIYY